MFQRRTTGSVVCRSCGRLVGVQDERCYNCGAWNPGLWGYAPLFRQLGFNFAFANVVIWGCGILYIVTLLYDLRGVRTGGVSLFAPSTQSIVVFGASGQLPVFGFGRWWTVLSAAWLHGGALHILFNMMWIRQLAPVTAHVYGASRLVIIYTVSAVAGFTLSTLGGVQLTLGASAPLFGLFGALVWAGKRTGSTEIGRQALFYAVIILAIGFFIPYVDYLAHIGGFIGGFLVSIFLDPLRKESFQNMVAAFVCLLLTALSVLVSLITAYI